MISALDIYRSANVLIREHGEGAAIEAAIQAGAMAEAEHKIGLAICVSAFCP